MAEELKALQQQLVQLQIMDAQIKLATAQLDAIQKPSLTDEVVGAGLNFVSWYIAGIVIFVVMALLVAVTT